MRDREMKHCHHDGCQLVGRDGVVEFRPGVQHVSSQGGQGGRGQDKAIRIHGRAASPEDGGAVPPQGPDAEDEGAGGGKTHLDGRFQIIVVRVVGALVWRHGVLVGPAYGRVCAEPCAGQRMVDDGGPAVLPNFVSAHGVGIDPRESVRNAFEAYDRSVARHDGPAGHENRCDALLPHAGKDVEQGKGQDSRENAAPRLAENEPQEDQAEAEGAEGLLLHELLGSAPFTQDEFHFARCVGDEQIAQEQWLEQAEEGGEMVAVDERAARVPFVGQPRGG